MPLDGTRVLIVEDEGMIAMMLEDMLLDLGCVVVGIAARLDEALAMTAAMAFDVAVLDVNLAGQLSYRVAEVLRARDIPFVLTTGYGMSGLPPELRGVQVLPKPFTFDAFAGALAQVRRA